MTSNDEQNDRRIDKLLFYLFHIETGTLDVRKDSLVLNKKNTIAIVFILFVIGALFCLSMVNRIRYFETTFDAEVWRRGEVRQRGRMVGDLIRSRLLIDMNRAEVVKLLGGPSRDRDVVLEYDFIYGSFFDDCFPSLPFAHWSQWLCIRFDTTTGRVCQVETSD
jgi:hypothetical protein